MAPHKPILLLAVIDILHRGLVSVSDDYRVLVHPRLTDHFPEVGIRQFNHQELKLPADSRFYPSPEKLQQHRSRFAFESLNH